MDQRGRFLVFGQSLFAILVNYNVRSARRSFSAYEKLRQYQKFRRFPRDQHLRLATSPDWRIRDRKHPFMEVFIVEDLFACPSKSKIVDENPALRWQL